MTAPSDYAVSQKLVHWIMAFLIIMDLFVAQKFGTLMETADRVQSRSDHASIGTIIAILFVIRLYLRWKHGAPALPADMPQWQRRLAAATHFLLYGLIGVLIGSGIITAFNADSPVQPFGLFAYGDGVEGSYDLARAVHQFITRSLMALIALHFIAALYHWLWLGDGVSGRMVRFWRRRTH